MLTGAPKVEFRLIVFRPFKGETLLGKISSATPEGINSEEPHFLRPPSGTTPPVC